MPEGPEGAQKRGIVRARAGRVRRDCIIWPKASGRRDDPFREPPLTQIDQTQKFIMRGRFGADSFIPWMDRHARKLGLEKRIIAASPERIEMAVKGPPALIDAMEMACSLGPIDIWVEDIECLPLNAMPKSDEPVSH